MSIIESIATYPGQDVLTAYLTKGREIGFVCVKDYMDCMKDGKRFQASTFLPGICECSPGDTPKVWPEKYVREAALSDARRHFECYLAEALADGWSYHR